MSEQCTDSLRCDPNDLRQAMSIHTKKITDSCRDKDCIEDLPVYLTAGCQALLDSSSGARVRCAELLSTYIDVEPVAFDRNHYCIDITFYYRIIADATVGASRPTTLYGLAAFSKRAVLCGEDSSAHIFRSDTRLYAPDGATKSFANRPTAVVEVTAYNKEGLKRPDFPRRNRLFGSMIRVVAYNSPGAMLTHIHPKSLRIVTCEGFLYSLTMCQIKGCKCAKLKVKFVPSQRFLLISRIGHDTL